VREEEITRQIGQLLGRFKLSQEVLQYLVDSLGNVYNDKIRFHDKQITEHERDRSHTLKMMEKMYIDKLGDKVSETMYEKLHQQFQEKLEDLDTRLRRLHEVDNDYYITAQYVLDLASRVHELFMSSEDEEKRHILNLLLLNPKLDGRNIVYDVRKPFDMIMECHDRQVWCAR
jgi:hypothetical protein